METELSSAQRMALRALEGGTLERDDDVWMAVGVREEIVLPDRIVRWLIGERYVAKAPRPAGAPEAYRLSERGRQAAARAIGVERSIERAAEVSVPLERVPVLLVAPAAHSEEMDWLLAIPLDRLDRDRHRRRLDGLRGWLETARDRFEFVQYADEVYAVPLSPRLASVGLVPDDGDDAILIAEGLPASTDLGAVRCSDRGVNFGSDWVQWFGGFDRELPLIVSARLSQATLTQFLERADRDGLDIP